MLYRKSWFRIPRRAPITYRSNMRIKLLTTICRYDCASESTLKRRYRLPRIYNRYPEFLFLSLILILHQIRLYNWQSLLAMSMYCSLLLSIGLTLEWGFLLWVAEVERQSLCGKTVTQSEFDRPVIAKPGFRGGKQGCNQDKCWVWW